MAVVVLPLAMMYCNIGSLASYRAGRGFGVVMATNSGALLLGRLLLWPAPLWNDGDCSVGIVTMSLAGDV